MQLTNSALSMLLKRYRAVLFKCRTLNWLGGTVLAAGLVLGAASGALAAQPPVNVWTSQADVVSTQDVFASEALVLEKGQFTFGADTTPGGIYLTVRDGAKITLNGNDYYTTSLFGYSAEADADDATAVPTTITGAGTQVTINTGSIGAGLPGAGNGAGPYAFTISDGATVLLNGAEKHQAVILATAAKADQMVTTISGQGTTVEVAAGKHGTIDAPFGNVSVANGATLAANGDLRLIAGGLSYDKATGAVSYDDTATHAAAFSINDGGTLSVGSQGKLHIGKDVTLKINGESATFANAGEVVNFGTLSAANGGHADLSSGTVSGASTGTFAVANGGHIKFSEANLSNVVSGTSIVKISKGMVSVDEATLTTKQLEERFSFDAAGGVLKVGTLNLKGDTVAITTFSSRMARVAVPNAPAIWAGEVVLDPATADNDVTLATDLTLTGENATLSVNGTGSLIVDDGSLGVDGTANIDTKVTVGGTNDGSVAVADGGNATFAQDVTVIKGAVTVAQGGTATVDGGTLKIDGANAAADIKGTLDVTGGTLETTTGADVTVATGGVVNATVDSLGITAADGDTASTTVKAALNAEAGSVINIEGLQKVDAANAGALVTALTNDAGGMVNVGTAEIENVDVAPDGTIDAGNLVAGLTNNALADAIATNVTKAADVTSAVKGVKLADSVANSTLTYDAASKVQLLGSEEGNNLVSDKTDALGKVNFGDNAGILTLGSGDTANSGTLGTVTFGNADATLNVLGNGEGGTFTLGAIDGTTDDKGTVTVKGTTLVTESIGATKSIEALNVSNGTVTSGAINTKGLTAKNGSTIAATGDVTIGAGNLELDESSVTGTGDFTSAGANDLYNAQIERTGDIDLSGGATQIGGTTSSIAATGGDVTLGATTMNGGTVSASAKDDGSKGNVTVGALTAQSGTNSVTATGGDLTLGGAVTTAVGASLALEAKGGDIIATTADTQATSLKASAAGDPAAGGDITATGKNIDAPVVQADGTIDVAGLTATGTETQAASVTATKLNATANVAVSDGTFSLTGAKDDGSTDSTVGGTLGLTNVDATVAGKLTVTGGLATIDGGTFEGKKGSLVTYGQGATIKNGADQKYATLAVNTVPLTVGDAADTESTRVGINELALNGQTLAIAGSEGAPAMAAVNSFTDGGDPADTRANGNITVGDNGQFSYGTADAGYAAQQMAVAAANGMDTTGVSSVFAVAGDSPLDMNGNDLTVGAAAKAGTAVIGDDTLTIVSAAAAKLTDGAGGAVNIGASNAEVGENAKLFIPDAQVGASYAVFDTTGTVTLDPTAWTGANLAGDNPLVALRNDDGVINARLNSAANVMPRLDKELVGAINAAAVANQIGTGERFVNSPEKGVRFLSRAISPDYLDAAANPDLAAQTIEGAARMITVGAVPQMTRAANQAAGEAVTQRTSLAQPTGIQTQEAGDHCALWIMPLYQSVNGFGMEAGNFDADFNGGLGGVAIGADYTFANAIRAGITFNIGGGYATGGGDFADTTNSMNFWGIGAYAGWTKNNFGLAADVNFTSAYNKLEQDLPAAMDMRDLKADVRSYAFSTGLRGEYKLETDVLDIIPHVGVRYMYLSTEDYKVKSEGTVLKGDGLNQNIWTFPVGVSFSKSIDTGNGWHFKPMVDLSVIPAAGDIKAKENVRFTGTDTRAELETQIMDYITYQGGLGFEVGNENLAFGLNGNVQFGAQTSGYGVLGTFRYEF